MSFRGAFSLLVLVAYLLELSGCAASSGANADPKFTSPLQKDSLYQTVAQGALPSISIQSSQKQLSAEYSASIEGTGSNLVGEMSISGNVGSIEVAGARLPTFIQENIPWTGMGYTLYQGLAFDETHFFVYWVYCQSGSISSVYIEGVDDQTLESENASGHCDSTVQDTSFEVSVPDIALKPIQPVQGFEIDGNQIYLSSASGLGIVDLPALGEKYLFTPFSRVDCSDCGNGGWQELHSMFWNESLSRVCFGIVYLQNQAPSEVSIDYSMCFPDLERRLDGVKIQSVWTKPTA
jgi:hypothetical protein